jgi:hypothetical protein
MFGTCGSSKWREMFINRYKMNSINFFNPQKNDWAPEDAVNEAEHLVNDDVILFPVTNETFGTGSLAETGYSILSAIRSNDQRFVIIFIDPYLNPLLSHTAAKESSRARAIVLAHLKKLNHPNVFIVDSLGAMLDLSVKLYRVVETMKDIRASL